MAKQEKEKSVSPGRQEFKKTKQEVKTSKSPAGDRGGHCQGACEASHGKAWGDLTLAEIIQMKATHGGL